MLKFVIRVIVVTESAALTCNQKTRPNKSRDSSVARFSMPIFRRKGVKNGVESSLLHERRLWPELGAAVSALHDKNVSALSPLNGL